MSNILEQKLFEAHTVVSEHLSGINQSPVKIESAIEIYKKYAFDIPSTSVLYKIKMDILYEFSISYMLREIGNKERNIQKSLDLLDKILEDKNFTYGSNSSKSQIYKSKGTAHRLMADIRRHNRSTNTADDIMYIDQHTLYAKVALKKALVLVSEYENEKEYALIHYELALCYLTLLDRDIQRGKEYLNEAKMIFERNPIYSNYLSGVYSILGQIE